jgi:Fe-S cluster assembly iron-binding protein IscA
LLGQHKNASPIRILLVEAAWSGQTLTMVLDEPRNGDKVFNRNGIIFVIVQEFFDQVKLIAVDYIASSSSSGFSISSVAYNFSLRTHNVSERLRRWIFHCKLWKAFSGLSFVWYGDTFDNICGKYRLILDRFNKGEIGANMGIICRGWDIDDLAFIRACSQRKASCCTAGWGSSVIRGVLERLLNVLKAIEEEKRKEYKVYWIYVYWRPIEGFRHWGIREL